MEPLPYSWYCSMTSEMAATISDTVAAMKSSAAATNLRMAIVCKERSFHD